MLRAVAKPARTCSWLRMNALEAALYTFHRKRAANEYRAVRKLPDSSVTTFVALDAFLRGSSLLLESCLLRDSPGSRPCPETIASHAEPSTGACASSVMPLKSLDECQRIKRCNHGYAIQHGPVLRAHLGSYAAERRTQG